VVTARHRQPKFRNFKRSQNCHDSPTQQKSNPSKSFSKKTQSLSRHRTHLLTESPWTNKPDTFDPLICDASFIHVSLKEDIVVPKSKDFTPDFEDEDYSAELPEDLSEITCTSSLSQDLTVTDLCDVTPFKDILMDEAKAIKKMKNNQEQIQQANFNYESILKFIKEGELYALFTYS